jgi:hypothetical protein
LVVEDGWHTCTNRDHLILPIFGDWLSAALRDQVATGFREVRITDETGYGLVFGADTQA